jgi:hypothetical protein
MIKERRMIHWINKYFSVHLVNLILIKKKREEIAWKGKGDNGQCSTVEAA